jgi:hypothetical protein
MNRITAETSIKAILAEICRRTQEAARIAKSAQACADLGSVDEAVTISMEIEQILYEAGRLQDAASLLNRLSRSS